MTTSSTPATARAAVHPVDGAQRARHARRGRDHHDAGRARDARRRRRPRRARGARPRLPAKSRIQSAGFGRTGRRSGARPSRPAPGRRRFAPAQLGVNGPVSRPSARAAAATASAMRRWSGSGQPRRRDVDGLLEGRAVQRIGLVEQRQHLQRAAGQDPFERELGPGDERFDRGSARPRPDPAGARRDRRAGARAARAPPPATRGSSARITPRLPDSISGLTTHGKPTPPGRSRARPRRRRRVPHGDREEARLLRRRGSAAAASRCAHEQLVRGRTPSPSGAFAGKPSRRAAAAATFAGSSPPTGSTAEIGASRASAAAIAAAAASGSLKSMTSESVGQCQARSST